MPTTVILATGAAFAAFPAFLVHTLSRSLFLSPLDSAQYLLYLLVWYRKDIVHRFHNTLKDEHDVHSCLMQYYPQVPMWWYIITGVISFAFICTTIEIFPTHLPIWAAIIGILIAFSLAIPIMTLQAISNQPAPTPVMYELIAGYMLPGRPIANAMFKTIVHTMTSQTCNFAGTMKLGHYMKIPPHTLFLIQIVAGIFSCIWVTVIQDWLLDNIKDICTPHQEQSFICPGSIVFATSSVIFGAVGPQCLFSPGTP
jgi:OPT family oligopeptide transporter